MTMATSLILLVLFLDIVLGFNGNSLHTRLISRQRSNIVALRDADIGKEIFPMNMRNSGQSSLNIRLTESTNIKPAKSFEDSNEFASKIRNFTSDREFASFLKSTAQKRSSLTQTDKQQIVDELLKRIPMMSVHSVSDALWSLGTLKMQFRLTVSGKRVFNYCQHF